MTDGRLWAVCLIGLVLISGCTQQAETADSGKAKAATPETAPEGTKTDASNSTESTDADKSGSEKPAGNEEAESNTDEPEASNTEVSLKSQIKEFQEKSLSAIPAEVLETFQNATAELKATGIEEKALKVGDKMPAFELQDRNGETVSSATLLEKGPLVLTFYRGSWCPYCNIELTALEKYRPQFQKQGATLIAISPEPFDGVKSSDTLTKINSTILRDPQNKLAEQFGIVFELDEKVDAIYKNAFKMDLTKINETEKSTLPMPATYVIDKEGVIQFAYAKADYTQRAEPSDVLAALKKTK